MKKQYFAPAVDECTICPTVNILGISTEDPNAGHEEAAGAAPARKLYV